MFTNVRKLRIGYLCINGPCSPNTNFDNRGASPGLLPSLAWLLWRCRALAATDGPYSTGLPELLISIAGLAARDYWGFIYVARISSTSRTRAINANHSPQRHQPLSWYATRNFHCLLTPSCHGASVAGRLLLLLRPPQTVAKKYFNPVSYLPNSTLVGGSTHRAPH